MRQPICGEGFCAQDPEPPPEPKPDNLGVWVFAAILVAFLIADAVLVLKKRRTMSQGLQRLSRARRWFRWLGTALLSLLTLHLFWGGPLW